MEKEEVSLILEEQRKYFATGTTLDPSFRIENLKKLRALLVLHEKEIVGALLKDIHKPEFEVVGTESGLVISEISFLIRKIKKWSRSKLVRTQLVNFPAISYVKPVPYGQVLVLSPWNFPIQLSILPLAGALAAGNCVVLKTSQQMPATSEVIKMIMSSFPRELIAYVDGGHTINDFLLEQRFDYIFFTGSPDMGKKVMKSASEHLTPVSLELGGKNPCVVTSDAALGFAVRRIAWGKFLNCGQVCTAPDYLLIDKKVAGKFYDLITKQITTFFGPDPLQSSNYARIINSKSVQRLALLMKDSDIVTGGTTDEQSCYVAPTVIKNISPDHPIMQGEIFGPILPVIEFADISEVYPIIEMNPTPLASYIFSENRKLVNEFVTRVRSGTVAVNDVVLQMASHHLPFGGVGNSGMGSYHGKKSFDTFSHMKSVLVKSNLIDITLRYPPYKKAKTDFLRWVMR
jgi:aldehyde dehydrogenase (NAD+)